MTFYRRVSCIVILVALTTQLQAANDFWLGGSGDLISNNYSNGTTSPVTPGSGDVVFLGNSGTLTHAVAGTTNIQKLRVGHNQATVGGVGAATLTVNGGAILNLSQGGTNANASLWVGNENNGTLNIDGVGSSVIATQVVQIGWGNNLNASGVVNITNGGELKVSAGNTNLATFNGTNPIGVPGTLNMSGPNSKFTAVGLNVGVQQAPGTYAQTGGTATLTGAIAVGAAAAANSSFSVSGGSLSTTGAITVGTGTATGSSFAVSGGTLAATGAITVGDNTAHASSFSISGGTVTAASVTIGETANNVTGSISNATVNIPTNNFNVGLGTSQNASVTIGNGADINITNTASSTGNVFIGRDTSTGATFNMTGGTIDTGRNFLLGNASGATGIVGNQSGGTITTTLNFVVTDTNGASTYNLNGAGAVVSNGLVIVGRQTATGVMNQTGGSVTAALGVHVGDAQAASNFGTGIYNLSAGTITAKQTTGTALSIGTAGTGTFKVTGDDAIIDVQGNMLVNAGGGSQGTLKYQLETGDVLSQIGVTGTATFNVGAILNFDTSLAAPTQTTYNVLTALDIVDNGITFNGPAGWSYRIAAGGNGEILQLFQGLPGDFNNDGKVDAGDYITWRTNEVANLPLANDGGAADQAARYALWSANFGNPPGAGSGSALGGAQVPEPASVFMILSAAVGLQFRRRR
jgi:hypothetical protein